MEANPLSREVSAILEASFVFLFYVGSAQNRLLAQHQRTIKTSSKVYHLHS